MLLRAGYVLSSVHESIREHNDALADILLDRLTAFDLSTNGALAATPSGDGSAGDASSMADSTVDSTVDSTAESLIAVASNIVSRGLPTLAPLSVERALAEATGWTRERTAKGSITVPFVEPLSEESQTLIRRALAPTAPAYPPSQVGHDCDASFDSDAEAAFLRDGLPSAVDDWMVQHVQAQRPLDTILDAREADAFPRQRVDFTIDLPAVEGRPSGLVLEVDGEQHQAEAQRRLDRKRDHACRQVGWHTLRIPARTAAAPPASVRDALHDALDGHPYVDLLTANQEMPLWTSDAGRDAMWLALVPIQVARIQKTLLHLVRTGHLELKADVWRLAVIERDVPGTRLAVRDLHDLLQALFDLEGKGRTVPDIDLQVVRSRTHDALTLDTPDAWFDTDPLADVEPDIADVVLDTSVLLHAGLAPLSLDALVPCATLRSAHAPTVEHQVLGGPPISYRLPAPPKRDVVIDDTEAEGTPAFKALLYLLRNLFRKHTFRPKQVDILCESLTGRDVIGLLPTGAGKSLTYQMSALLQPGLTLVVSPLKSLMHDQAANLKRAGIGHVRFINSSLSTEERRAAQDAMHQGRCQFAFIAPERLLIQEFRDDLSTLEIPIAYCVVDEAHCVSEWGHDFRTAYLRLGPNARTHFPTAWPDGLPVIALTGTASFDVLGND